MRDGTRVVALRQNLAQREACGSVVGGTRDEIPEERQRLLLAIEIEDDLHALPGRLDITVRGHRRQLPQTCPASGRASVALLPVAGHPLAPGAVERGRERLEPRAP